MSHKVLLIEDNESDQKLILNILSGIDMVDAVAVNSGEDGLKQAELTKPKVIILDTILPSMDGYEVCRQIKAIDGYDPRVIMITGVAEAVSYQRAREAGADDYTVKTINPDEFKHSLTVLVRKHI